MSMSMQQKNNQIVAQKCAQSTLESSPTMMNCMPQNENLDIFNNSTNCGTKRTNPENNFKNRSLREIQNIHTTQKPDLNQKIDKQDLMKMKCQEYNSILTSNLEFLCFLVHVSKTLHINKEIISINGESESTSEYGMNILMNIFSKLRVIDKVKNKGYWDSLENSVLKITQTLFKDLDTSDEEFNENWEFAISEVIVSLDDKVCKKKEVIQEQLCDLDKFRNYLSERKQRLTRTGQHKISKLNHQTNDALSKSFDQGDNMTNFINNKHLKKSVKWDECNLKSKVDLTEEIEFL